jgi:hypothetical protein
VAQTMYIHVSKCKNDKIKKIKFSSLVCQIKLFTVLLLFCDLAKGFLSGIYKFCRCLRILYV